MNHQKRNNYIIHTLMNKKKRLISKQLIKVTDEQDNKSLKRFKETTTIKVNVGHKQNDVDDDQGVWWQHRKMRAEDHARERELCTCGRGIEKLFTTRMSSNFGPSKLKSVTVAIKPLPSPFRSCVVRKEDMTWCGA